jgi:hypothetical protein
MGLALQTRSSAVAGFDPFLPLARARLSPIADITNRCEVGHVRTVRRSWLFFGILLACGIIAFTVSVDWATQSWLDLAAYAVSVIAILGVLIYAFGGVRSRPVFWRAFRWVFIGVVTAQVLAHAIRVAQQHGYSVVGTIIFIAFVAAVVGWIFALQWIAMTRLAKTR